MNTIVRRLLYFFRRSRYESDLLEEIETHRALRQAALERDGLEPEEAAHASRRATGNITLAVEDVREVWVVRAIDEAWQDIRIAIRVLRKSPSFAFAAIVTLALGIGANSAIFSVINAVLLRPLPFPDPKRVVHLAWDAGGHLQSLSAMKFQYWHDHAESFEAAATWRSKVARGNLEGEPSTMHALAVSPDFFAVVGHAPERGPAFTPTDFVPGGPTVAIISHAMWEARFARAADLAGRTIRLEGEPVAIVGVLPESFAFPYQDEPIDVIVPLHMTVEPNDIAEDWPAVARLRDGVTHEQARVETSALMAAFRTAYPSQVSDEDRGMRLATFNEPHGQQDHRDREHGRVRCFRRWQRRDHGCARAHRWSAGARREPAEDGPGDALRRPVSLPGRTRTASVAT